MTESGHAHDLTILMDSRVGAREEPTHVVCDDCGQLWPLGPPIRQIGAKVSWDLLLKRWANR